MTYEEKILSGILVGLVLWLMTKSVSFLLRRERIKAGLLTDIELHIKRISETKEYLSGWIATLTAKKVIKYSAIYSADECKYFNGILTELPTLFTKNIFTKILRYYNSINEFDVLVGGFFKDVTTWKHDKRELSKDDLSYLARKVDRITSLAEIITNKQIADLDELPIDYEGKVSPKTIIK